VEVFEIEGPLFFGAAYKFREEIKILQNKPKALILRMRFVPYIDETGLHAIEEFFEATEKSGTKLVLSGVREEILKDLIKSGVANKIGLDNIKPVIDDAVARVWELTNE
jgi:SulP family sulfate permease